MAILIDPERATEWAEGASKVSVVFQDDSQAIVHTYIDILWPVWDRELVTSSKLRTITPGEEYIPSMTAVDGFVPKKERVVRMKDAKTEFHLKKRAPGKVWVEYLVNVDPGGSYPGGSCAGPPKASPRARCEIFRSNWTNSGSRKRSQESLA